MLECIDNCIGLFSVMLLGVCSDMLMVICCVKFILIGICSGRYLGGSLI